MKKILKFYSKTCGPCKVMSNKLTGIKNAEIKEIDIEDDSNETLLETYEISTIPTIIVLSDDNSFLAKFTGITQIEDIQEVINGK